MEAEQDAYARLSVFRGGFTREAAQAVAGASVRDLMSLVNKSLLWRDPENGRYRQHRLLRDYASNRLRARGEEQETRRKHAQFYTELAEELDERLRGPNELPFYVQMADESRNFSAVLEWSFAKTENAVLGGRLFGALGWNWFVVDNTVDGPYWMERALTFLDAYPPAVRARVLNRSGFIGCTIGAYHQAAEQHHEAVRLFRQLNDNWQVSWALLAEANMSYSAGMADRAYVLSKESLKLAYHEEEPLLLHWALRTAAYHEALQDHHERAERLYEESFQIADFLENRRARMNAYFSKAEFALKYRHADDVEENYWRALEIAREIGRKSGVVNATLGLGLASYLHGDYRKASAFGQQALEMSQDIGHHTLSAEALVELGLYAIRNLDLEGAAAYFIRCLQMTQHTDMAARQAISVFGLGLIAAENEPNERAAKMLAAAESALKDLDLHVELAIFASEWDRAFAEYRPRLDSEAWETGGNMSLDQAVALALKSWPQQSILT
jgi:tetratricopeptide (TPR) repeat protein